MATQRTFANMLNQRLATKGVLKEDRPNIWGKMMKKKGS